MAETILLEIVTPLRKLLSREVDEVTAPGRDGDFGVLAGHTPFLTTLRPGEISYKKGAETGRRCLEGPFPGRPVVQPGRRQGRVRPGEDQDQREKGLKS
jgi:hypothetical protein